MNNRGHVLIGVSLVLLGLVFLVGTIFQINIWAICFPLGLIVVGIWLVARPSQSGTGSDAQVLIIGDIDRRGSWAVHDQVYWIGISDVDLDFTAAQIPTGETRLSFYSFVGDLDLFVPRDVGVRVRTTGFYVEATLFGEKHEKWLTAFESSSRSYAAAEKRLLIDVTCFVNEIKVRQV